MRNSIEKHSPITIMKMFREQNISDFVWLIIVFLAGYIAVYVSIVHGVMANDWNEMPAMDNDDYGGIEMEKETDTDEKYE